MKHIVICDDDLSFAQFLAQETQTFFRNDCQVSIYQSADELRRMKQSEAPDIALMDIQLDAENGITLAKELFPGSTGTSVIFITGYVEYCTDVYETEHIYFLLKPLQTDKLHKALEKAIRSRHSGSVSFPIHTNGTLHRIDLDQVRYIESFYRKLRIFTTSGMLETYGAISALPKAVLQEMIHCHKSFLVNPSYVKTMTTDFFTLSNDTSIPISHSSRAESRRLYLEYLTGQMEGN